jgi:nucleoside-triphosphatase THEP1
MMEESYKSRVIQQDKIVYYRLVALWVACEAMLGGIIHGFKIPVSGLVVGSCAVVCICLIGWFVPRKGAILQATIVVAIFKMMLSPQAPLPAYIAVFFQGLVGELLFYNRKHYKLSCMLLAILALLESGLQRIFVLTVLYGNDFWNAVNTFINGLTKQKDAANFSLIIGIIYVVIHLVTGVFVGWWAARLPQRIDMWKLDPAYSIEMTEEEAIKLPPSKKKRRIRVGLLIVYAILLALYVQSYFNIGRPLLPAHISLKILLRSLIILFTWYFLVSPLLTKLMHVWLKRKRNSSQQDVKKVLEVLPMTRTIIAKSWSRTSGTKGLRGWNAFAKSVLVNALQLTSGRVVILTGDVQTGKTTSLLNWSSKREDVSGILTPVIDGKRMFINASKNEVFSMEANEFEKDVLRIGRFVFSHRSFDKASDIIRRAIGSKNWLVIDEIGPLELKGEGFSSVLREALAKRKGRNLLIVVRQGLVDDVIQEFKIERPVTVSLKDLGKVLASGSIV